MPKTRLMIALDVPDLKPARLLLEKLKGLPVFYKVGSSLFTLAGPAAVDLAHQYGGKVFLDLKFHDIPNTVKNAVANAAKLGVYSISLHLCGGAEMVRAAAGVKKRPELWGITALTGFDAESFARAGFKGSIEEAVFNLADAGVRSGVNGIVCSPREAAAVRERFGPGIKVITPGIRLGKTSDDQKRSMAPKEAARAGADFIVIGRPVLKAKDPARAAAAILKEIE